MHHVQTVGMNNLINIIIKLCCFVAFSFFVGRKPKYTPVKLTYFNLFEFRVEFQREVNFAFTFLSSSAANHSLYYYEYCFTSFLLDFHHLSTVSVLVCLIIRFANKTRCFILLMKNSMKRNLVVASSPL